MNKDVLSSNFFFFLFLINKSSKKKIRIEEVKKFISENSFLNSQKWDFSNFSFFLTQKDLSFRFKIIHLAYRIRNI